MSKFLTLEGLKHFKTKIMSLLKTKADVDHMHQSMEITNFQTTISESISSSPFTELDDVELQCCHHIHNSTGWISIEFNQPFSDIPEVTCSGTSGNNIVQIRNVTRDGFEYDVRGFTITKSGSSIVDITFTTTRISYPIMFIAMVKLGSMSSGTSSTGLSFSVSIN